MSLFFSQQDYVVIIAQLQSDLETARQEAAAASAALSTATLGFLTTNKVIADQILCFKDEAERAQKREKDLWTEVTYPLLPQQTRNKQEKEDSSERQLSTMFNGFLKNDELFQSYDQGLKRVEAAYRELEELKEHFGKSIPTPFSAQFHDPSGYWKRTFPDKKEKKKERIVFGGDGVIRYFTNGALGKHKIAGEEEYPFYPHPTSPNTVCMVWLQNLKMAALDSHLPKDPNTKSYLVTFTITDKDKMTIQRPVRSNYESGTEAWVFVPGNVEAEEATEEQ